LLNSFARDSTGEQTVWQQCWAKTMFGNQLELDDADRMAEAARDTAKGKGLRGGKGARHWTHQHIWFNALNPFPLELDITVVDEIAFCWDEYCDKFGDF
jgi:hypothetical protein